MRTVFFLVILFVQSSLTCFPDPPLSCEEMCKKACPDSDCFDHCMEENCTDERMLSKIKLLQMPISNFNTFLDLFLTNFNILIKIDLKFD